uniref:Uncharacterized protein n=1 Tax=Angiostrongylus cantonensis TaxID=6313 RepID=A0A0K0DEN8_ANGCA
MWSVVAGRFRRQPPTDLTTDRDRFSAVAMLLISTDRSQGRALSSQCLITQDGTVPTISTCSTTLASCHPHAVTIGVPNKFNTTLQG